MKLPGSGISSARASAIQSRKNHSSRSKSMNASSWYARPGRRLAPRNGRRIEASSAVVNGEARCGGGGAAVMRDAPAAGARIVPDGDSAAKRHRYPGDGVLADDVGMPEHDADAQQGGGRSAGRFGLVGGIGPESTIVYYRLILEEYRRRRPGGGAPPLLINTIDLARMLGLIDAADLTGLTDYLVDEIQVLVDAGARWGALAANTPHLVFDAIQARVTIPLTSIVEVTCSAAREQGFRRLGLFGTASTMGGRFYPDVFSRSGIKLVTPDAPDQAEINEIYLSRASWPASCGRRAAGGWSRSPGGFATTRRSRA